MHLSSVLLSEGVVKIESSVDCTFDADCIDETILVAGSSNDTHQHEIEPEHVEASECAQIREEHVQHGVVHILAWLVLVAFFIESPYDVTGEEPESEIDPWHYHSHVCGCLNEGGCDVHSELEEGCA